MKKETNKLKILLLEDMLTDVEIVKHELRKSNYDFELNHVDTGESYLKELNEFNPDIIISDYYLPNFDGLTALDLAKKKYPFTPFILITGTSNEEIAVECMKRGADDYLIKKHLKRLNPAIKKALDAKHTRELKHRAEEKYRSIFENATEGIFQTTPEEKIIIINPAMARMLGYESVEEQMKLIKNIGEQVYVNQQHRETLKELLRKNKSITGFETQFYKKDGSKIWVSINIREVCDSKGNLLYYEGTNHDITARKKAEEENQLLLTLTKTIAEATDFDSTLTSALKMICECTAWGYGEAWIPNSNLKHLELSPSWFTKINGVESFRKASERFTFAPGVGLPGRVWKSKKPVWITDVSVDANFPRAPFAKEVGFRAAVGIPILAKDKVVAVMSFFLRDLHKEDERMISLISAIAEELGMLFQRKITEEALQQAEKKYRNIFENVVEGIYQTTFDGKLLTANPALVKMFGYESEEEMISALNDSLSQLYVDPNRRNEWIDKLVRDHSIKEFESQVYRKDGKKIWISENSYLILSEAGDILYCEGTVKDITLSKQQEERLLKLSSAVEQTSDSVIMTDQDGTIEFVNQAFVDLSGYTLHEVIGKKPSSIKSGLHDDKFFQELWSKLLVKKPFIGNIINRKKSGELFHCNVHISPIVDNTGKITNFVGVYSDITDLIRKEEELIEAKDHAEEMNRLKDSFLANMSHEFRTPMNAILGFSDLLMERLRNSEHQDLYEFSKSLNNGAQRLLNLLNDVLDISLIEANKMYLNIEAGLLVNTVESVKSVLSILAKEKNLEMLTVTNSSRKAYFDTQRFEQALINVIMNAIRFTEKGKITIEVDEGTNEKNEPCGVVRVIDTGRGISKEFLPHAFDAFRQGSEGYSRTHEGSGLGLTISQRLMNLMNGDIKIESEQGVGTTVTLYVPLAENL
jgi:PAS domain S-box-containing protein